MTIFVICQLIVTLDSIRNSCDVCFTLVAIWTSSQLGPIKKVLHIYRFYL